MPQGASGLILSIILQSILTEDPGDIFSTTLFGFAHLEILRQGWWSEQVI